MPRAMTHPRRWTSLLQTRQETPRDSPWLSRGRIWTSVPRRVNHRTSMFKVLLRRSPQHKATAGTAGTEKVYGTVVLWFAVFGDHVLQLRALERRKTTDFN